MTDEVTMGEVVRRLDGIAVQLAAIIAGQAEDRRHNTDTFVSKENLRVQLENVGNKITEAEKDIVDVKAAQDKQQDRNRGMVIALIGIAVPALISIVGLILTIVGAGATP